MSIGAGGRTVAGGTGRRKHRVSEQASAMRPLLLTDVPVLTVYRVATKARHWHHEGRFFGESREIFFQWFRAGPGAKREVVGRDSHHRERVGMNRL